MRNHLIITLRSANKIFFEGFVKSKNDYMNAFINKLIEKFLVDLPDFNKEDNYIGAIHSTDFVYGKNIKEYELPESKKKEFTSIVELKQDSTNRMLRLKNNFNKMVLRLSSNNGYVDLEKLFILIPSNVFYEAGFISDIDSYVGLRRKLEGLKSNEEYVSSVKSNLSTSTLDIISQLEDDLNIITMYDIIYKE